MTPAHYQAQVMAGAQHNAAARLGQITCPVNVLFGEFDKVVPPANAPLLAARLPSARVTILPDTGHIFPIEDPPATVQALLDFLL